MLRRSAILLSLFALAFYVIIPLNAQTNFSGDWKADIDKDKAGKIHLQFSRDVKNGKNMHGSNYELSELQGLTSEQVFSSNSTVNFRLVREAGTIDCQGIFRNGKGLGEWRFTANQSYLSGMRSRGYELSDEKMFSAATLNLTLADVDDLKNAGFDKLDVQDLFKAKIFKVDSTYAKEMKELGFPNLDMEDLVKARIFKVDASYARQVNEMGFKDTSLEELVKFRIFKITPEFLKGMKDLGFDNLKSEEAVRLQIFKITPEFVNSLKAEGLNNLSIEEVVRMKIHKVDAEFIKKAKADGLKDLDVDELVRLRIHGKFRSGQHF